jgi:hypothetical protein
MRERSAHHYSHELGQTCTCCADPISCTLDHILAVKLLAASRCAQKYISAPSHARDVCSNFKSNFLDNVIHSS